jgi:hypothetical protein
MKRTCRTVICPFDILKGGRELASFGPLSPQGDHRPFDLRSSGAAGWFLAPVARSRPLALFPVNFKPLEFHAERTFESGDQVVITGKFRHRK